MQMFLSSNLSYLDFNAFRTNRPVAMISATVTIFLGLSVLGVLGYVQEGKIIGGRPVADIQTVPYHAAIEMAGVDLQFCSAAIISTEWVITSGHCVALLLPIDIQIRVGTVRNAFGGTVYQVSEIVQHPLFDQVWFTSVDYDVGAVRTETPIVLGLDVKPIALPETGAQVPEGTIGLVSGWGVISSNDGALPPRSLQIGELGIIDQSACNLTEEYNGNITSRMLCAGGDGQDVCFGDNGGPLVIDNIVFGIVSWGIGCGISAYESVFTNVADPEIRDFVRNSTGL